MFNFFNKWKKVEATNIPTPRPKDSVQTKLNFKRISLEVQRRYSRKLQLLINKGQHIAQPIHCISRMKKIKGTFSSNIWMKLSGNK